MTVVLHLDVPESPTDLNIIDINYSTISFKWKAGFDGGLTQTFWILLDNLFVNETNQSYFTLTSKFK
jgi:hypothetical protein